MAVNVVFSSIRSSESSVISVCGLLDSHDFCRESETMLAQITQSLKVPDNWNELVTCPLADGK